MAMSPDERAAKVARVRELEALLRRRHRTTPERLAHDAKFDSRTSGDEEHGDEFLEDEENRDDREAP